MISAPLHILLVEDNEGDARLIEEYLDVDPPLFEVQRARTLAEARTLLQEESFDAALLDLGLPDSFGIETLEALVSQAGGVPIIVLTGQQDVGLATAVLRSGARDYLVKGRVDGDLLRRVSRYVVAQQRSARELQWMRAAVDVASVGVLWIRPDGGFSYANEAAAKTLGYTREQLLTLSVADVDLDSPQRVRASHFHLLKERRRMQLESRYRARDGRTFPVEISTHYVEAGGEAFEFAFVQDLSERLRMQASLAQADRLASVGLLAAGVAHEINNPLTYIVFNLESLVDDLPDILDLLRRQHRLLTQTLGLEAAHEQLGALAPLFDSGELELDVVERVRDSLDGAYRVRDIVRDLKTFSRSDDRQLEAVSINAALEAACNMAANELKYRARVIKNFGELPLILANDGRLSQVFLNLLVNAAHAIPEGAAEHNEVRVRTWSEEGRVFAEVSDTGEGIPPAHVQRIFEPFFSTKEVGVGSGLGLAICHGIVSGFGGEISVETALGRGTTFRISLPVNDDLQSSVPVAERLLIEDRATRGRLLVVDDEPQICAVLARLLGSEHEVVVAPSGTQAQALLEKDQAFDLILCDLMMPEVTGMDLHAWLAVAHPELAEAMVFITGGAFTPRARTFLAAVPNLHIDKPFAPRDIRAMVRELVRSRRGEA